LFLMGSNTIHLCMEMMNYSGTQGVIIQGIITQIMKPTLQIMQLTTS
jgi:hypothetical protein